MTPHSALTPLMLALIIFTQFTFVGAQLLLKHAMNATNHEPKQWTLIIRRYAAAIAILAMNFFLWLGFLKKLDLSYLFPFEALSPVILVVCAQYVFREKIPARAWLGIGCIVVGITLVAFSGR